MSNLIMLALVGDMKLLLFVFMLAFDDEFNANVDEDREVVRFVVAVVVEVDVVVLAVVVVVLVDDAPVDENEPLFAPVFTN